MNDANKAADLPDAGEALQGIITRRFHQIYNPAELKQAIEQLEGGAAAGDDDGWTDAPTVLANLSSEDTNRLRVLKRIAADPKGHRRRSIVGSRGMVSRIEALASQMPHFAPVIDLVARATLVSARTSTPLRLPPILLLGEPGIGKTYTIRQLGEAIGADFTLIAANITDAFRLRGLNTAWRGARMGRIAEILLESSTTPIIALDEYDKAPGLDRIERPYDVWHTLLERENAGAGFRDDYLEIALQADEILWFASANDLGSVPWSILDRMLVLEIPSPDRNELQNIITSIYIRCREAHGGMLPGQIADDVLAELARHNPRRISRILDLAVGFAAASGRRQLNCDDVRRADQLAGETPEPNRKGFRGPVGFTRHRTPH